jgi:hypothetical protein
MGRGKAYTKFWWGNLKEWDQLGDPDVRRYDNHINIDLQEVGCGGMDWIGLAENKKSWRALVNAAMNLRVP